MPRTRSRRQPPRRRRAGPSGNHDGRSRQNSPDWQGASGPSDQPSCVGGETDEAPRQTAWPAADRLTVGYRRGGDQLRRGILTGEEPTPNAGCRKWRLPAVLRPWPSDSSRPAPNSASAASSWSQAFWEIVPQKHVVTTLELFPREVRPRVGERSSWFCVTNGMGTVEIPISAASASFAHGILAVNGSGRVPDAPLQVSCPEFARRYNLARVSRLFAAG
jgi:hypothetical protein